MFSPYLANLRQLCTCWNHYTALVLELKYSTVIAFLSFTIKYILLGNITLYLSLCLSLFASSLFSVLCNTCLRFCVVLFSHVNIIVVLLLLFLGALLVCLFPLVECTPLLYLLTASCRVFFEKLIVTQLVKTFVKTHYCVPRRLILDHILNYLNSVYNFTD
jgi:hypothetical protein